MVLDIPGGLFGQDDVREAATGTSSAVIQTGTIAVAQWTASSDTASTSYVDVAGATVTLSGLTASKTYSAMAICCVDAEITTAGVQGNIVLDIGGTEVSECRAGAHANSNPHAMSVNGARKGITGVTSITAKIKVKVDSATIYINRDSLKKEIVLTVMEE